MKTTDWEFIKGIEKIEVDRVAKDYIKIEYGDNSTLYILPTSWIFSRNMREPTQKRQS